MMRPVIGLTLALALGVTAAVPAQAASTYAKTKYPIVLAHGMAGFANIGPMDYWHGIPSDLRNNGAKVYLTTVSSFHSSEYRGEQLLRQVQDILAITGAQKVNLIGHSHGAQSIRYVAGVLPNRVASVTSVGGVNRGAPAPNLLKLLSHITLLGDAVMAVVNTVANGFGLLFGLTQGQMLSQDFQSGMESLTSAGAYAFNAKFPAGLPNSNCGEGDYNVNGVAYYSWSGTSKLTNPLDVTDYALGLVSAAFLFDSLDSQNDGLVGRCSSRLGKVLRDNYAMNHFDEINHVFGLTKLFDTDPRAVYRAHANRLKNSGL